MKEDQVSYSKADWEFIYSRKPELRPRPKQKQKNPTKPSLDSIIVLFLEKYEVYLKPPSTKDGKSLRESAIAGGFAGLSPIAGLGVAGIQGQRNNADKHEWIQWKQWTLDHKDFPAFKEETLLRIEEENKNNKIEISEVPKDPLSNPAIRKEIAALMEGRNRNFKFFLLLLLGIVIAVVFTNSQ